MMTFGEMYYDYILDIDHKKHGTTEQLNIIFPIYASDLNQYEWLDKLTNGLVDSDMLEFAFLNKYGDLEERITDLYPIASKDSNKYHWLYSYPNTCYWTAFSRWLASIDGVMTHALGLAKMNYTPYENYDKHSTITTTNSGSDTVTNVIGEVVTDSYYDSDTNTKTIGAHTDKEKYMPTITTYDQDIEYNQGSDETQREFAQQMHQDHRNPRTDNTTTYEHTDTNTTAHGHKIVVTDETHGNIGVMDGATMGLKDYEYMVVNDLREFFFKLYVRDFGGNSWGVMI